MEEERTSEQLPPPTKKVTPLQLREQYSLKTADLAWKANVSPRVVYFMLLGHPVTRQEAERVLAAISKIAEQPYTLDNVQVTLTEAQQGAQTDGLNVAELEKMNIAVLAWSSLVWKPRELALSSPWELNGPEVPLEFSRVSLSRSGALSLVIDSVHGCVQPTYVALSAFQTLDEAIENLGEREEGGRECVGSVNCRSGDWYSRQLPSIVGSIAGWGWTYGFDAIIWTDLEANFETIDKSRFSDSEPFAKFTIEHAQHYLHGLRAPGDALARAYINRAPEHIQTPLRQRLAHDPWLVISSQEERRPSEADTTNHLPEPGTIEHEGDRSCDA